MARNAELSTERQEPARHKGLARPRPGRSAGSGLRSRAIGATWWSCPSSLVRGVLLKVGCTFISAACSTRSACTGRQASRGRERRQPRQGLRRAVPRIPGWIRRVEEPCPGWDRVDEALLAWAEERGGRRPDLDCGPGNAFMMKRGFRDEVSAKPATRIQESGLEGKPIRTMFDYIDFDEGRDPVSERRGRAEQRPDSGALPETATFLSRTGPSRCSRLAPAPESRRPSLRAGRQRRPRSSRGSASNCRVP